MAHEQLHEAASDLSAETRDMHRALISLQEELEAVDWYRQRADACKNPQLRAILLHNMRDEMEHSAMLIEWLRRKDADFAEELRTFLFTEAPIVEIEEGASEAEGQANVRRNVHADEPPAKRSDESRGVPSSIAEDRLPTIGALKEKST